MRRCLHGDAAAWRSLVEAYAPLVHTIAKRSGLTPDACDDVVQSTFMALHRSLASIRDLQALPKWVITTATREAWAIAHQHKAARGDLDLQAAPPVTDETVEGLDRARMVNAGLQKLGGRCEELLRLLFSGSSEPDYRHIAATLGMPIGSIGPTRSRCLAKLAELLDKPA